MLGVQVLYMVVSGAPPAWLSFAALLILLSVPTAGAAVAWLGTRITRDATERRAALVFAGLGLVAGALWGRCSRADRPAARRRRRRRRGALVAGAAAVVGVTAAVGAGLGRLVATEASDRPLLVVVLGVVVVLVAILGLVG